jgi:hypothetical protein
MILPLFDLYEKNSPETGKRTGTSPKYDICPE